MFYRLGTEGCRIELYSSDFYLLFETVNISKVAGFEVFTAVNT